MVERSDTEDSPLAGFHSCVRRWFDGRFDRPTPAQRRGWPAIRSGKHTLISAPTGSGKTLAAFLNAIDELLRSGLETGGLPEETRVLYVSPLKALSADVHRNLTEPRREITEQARSAGLDPPRITAGLRTGDTPRSERRQMKEHPPHLLVTTPESLYLLLTAEKSRSILRTVRTVIVDEIHAVIESRRGSHLSLTLERLEALVEGSLQRIGLSATQRPIDEVARFLVGTDHLGEGGPDEAPDGVSDPASAGVPEYDEDRLTEGVPDCEIVDEGHEQTFDLDLEVPESPLEAVMPREVWEEIYDRIAELVESHETTLVFVNTRREAERIARDLGERVGTDRLAAHHGSLAREARLRAERGLQDGSLDALVATASLELGIDVGHVDLVCQLGSPHRISSFLQRVGRSGHTVQGTPRGRLFPLSRDDLFECAALIRSVRAGELDRTEILEAPLDILSQQIVAAAACRDWSSDELFTLIRRAYPYRDLEREIFDEVVEMLADGFSTRNGRRGARIHFDAINDRISGRKGSRLAALTSGGAIPDNADYRMLKEPEGTFVGTLNEDFAVESLPGDVVQLGNTSWRILRVETGVVRVEDAQGEPPNIPFWLGEAPARSRELSRGVSDLRSEIARRLQDGEKAPEQRSSERGDTMNRKAALSWLLEQEGFSRPAATQMVAYLADGLRVLNAVPTQDRIVIERFFDETGGMQLVIHSPFGRRVNRAWGLALRKRFCRRFNFELQAAATEDGVLLSLGPQHSFPLDEVVDYLHPDRVEEVLTQAVLDAPVFQTRWRWNATLSLALLRWKGGSKVAPQIQRMEAEDLLTAVFPDANACLENVDGERVVPDHPLVRQTVKDCLEEVMSLTRLEEVLEGIRAGRIETVVRETTEPSPLCHEILNARPYAFLDDAPIEERRTRAVYTRRTLDPADARALGALDEEAIRSVREEVRPDPESPDELHDTLLTFGYLLDDDLPDTDRVDGYLRELVDDGRATRVEPDGETGAERWIAAEWTPRARVIWPDPKFRPKIALPDHLAEPPDSREAALRELLRHRMGLLGPITADRLAEEADLSEEDVERTLADLEQEGLVLRGGFTAAEKLPEGREHGRSDGEAEATEWCDRTLLARIHRRTLDHLRSRIQPVSAADFMRFLLRWQHVEPGRQVEGVEGVVEILRQLEGAELPAAAWEPEVLGPRVDGYEPDLLDELCRQGRIVWGRLRPPESAGSGFKSGGPLRSTPVSLWRRRSEVNWVEHADRPGRGSLSSYAEAVLEVLGAEGASFFPNLVRESGLIPTHVEQALGELVAHGWVTADSFGGLRALLVPSDRRPRLGGDGAPTDRSVPYAVDRAGRWSLLRNLEEDLAGEHVASGTPGAGSADPGSNGRSVGAGNGRSVGWGPGPEVEPMVRVLLRRYGVIFRALLRHETGVPPWREVLPTCRRLEARGEIRGGRFVAGFSGEQFALPEAVGMVRSVREESEETELIVLSGADPLNLTGVLFPGSRIPARATYRIGFRGGVPKYLLRNGSVERLSDDAEEPDHRVKKKLVRRPVPPELRSYAPRPG